MKKIFVFLIGLACFQASAQDYAFEQAWFVSGGAGTCSFMGDVAPVQKFSFDANGNEFQFGYVFRMGKKVVPAFDLNVEFMGGNLSGTKLLDAGDNNYDRQFSGDFRSVTLNARFDPLKLFNATKDSRISFFGRIGAGPMYYRSIMTKNSNGDYVASMGYLDNGTTKDKRQYAMVMPYGVGVCFDFSDNVRIEAEADIYNSFTDNLDAMEGNTKFKDQFLSFSFSLVYGFDWDHWQTPKFND